MGVGDWGDGGERTPAGRREGRGGGPVGGGRGRGVWYCMEVRSAARAVGGMAGGGSGNPANGQEVPCSAGLESWLGSVDGTWCRDVRAACERGILAVRLVGGGRPGGRVRVRRWSRACL